MASHVEPDSPDIRESAVHACAQCKASKKKCDKALPSCNRCSRLILRCIYDEGAGIAPAEIISKFQAVFDRLDRLEENVFAPTAATNASPTPRMTLAARPKVPEADKWQLSPQLLQPSYLGMIAGGSVFRILEEKDMTMRGLVHKYFDTIHNYMPIMSKVKLNKQIQELEGLNSKSAFMVLILAILLLTEHPPADSDGALGSSELYQVCKYHFSLFLSLKEPSIELIQAGLCITLYEYVHGIPERAYVTIGTCARMVSVLRLHSNANSAPQSALTEDYFDENAHVISAMHLLNRHICLSFTMLGKHLNSEYSPIIEAREPPMTSVMGRAVDALSREAEGCRILCRLQQIIHEDIPACGPGTSWPTQLDRVIALDTELQNMKLGFQDYNDSSTWRGDFAAYAVASLFMLNLVSQQEEILPVTECFGQRHMEILTSIEMLMKMVNSQLSNAVATGYNADFLTPFSMTILALGANGLESISSMEMGEECKLNQTRVFTDLLRCLGARWRLGKEYLKTIDVVRPPPNPM